MYVCMYIWVIVEWVYYFYVIICSKISQFQSIGIGYWFYETSHNTMDFSISSTRVQVSWE